MNESRNKDLNTIPFRLDYSDRTSLMMAQISSWSYSSFEKNKQSKKTLGDELNSIGFKLEDVISGRGKGDLLPNVKVVDTQAIWALRKDDSLAVLAFRGTEPKDARDWVTDLKITLEREADGVDIHRGFLRAYEAVEDHVKGWIEGHKGPIIVTGHSLGGALATLATVMFRHRPFAACYTFGGPRIGSVEADLIKTPIFRVTNDRDIVPDVPVPVPGILTYRHLGSEFHITHSGDLERREGDRFFDGIKGRSEDILADILAVLTKNKTLAKAIIGNIDDHGSQNYVTKLRKIAKARN